MTTPTTTDPAPVGDLTEALEKLHPYYEQALKHGIVLRPITGLMLRLGDMFGVDIDAVGEETTENPESKGDNEFYDALTRAVWVLAEKEEILVEVAAAGLLPANAALLRWKLKHFTCLEAEAGAMRAFVARWFEHRVEMTKLYGVGGAAPADA